MANLSLRHIYKVYPNGAKAVSDFNMEIKDKEFIVFVGPSGCGKSTTLRMIAGLEDITAGELFIGDRLVNDVEPKDRDIAMVFQNYALYPHMTVYDNMAFGLKLRHVPAAEIHEKIMWAAKILGLEEYLDRKPKAMSGGQRQRVALGRAILRNPKVFLLDEPLSNLDAKLRTQMRSEISKLHQRLGTTFIYVTHDQVEAMTMGTRIVVMKLGRVQQIDTPKNLYRYPNNKFVAGFIGTPQMNFFEGNLKRNKDNVEIKLDYCDDVLNIPFNDMLKVNPSYLNGKKKVFIGLRCENVTLDPKIVENSKNKLKVKISHFEELGNETLIYGDLNMQGDGFTESSTRIIIKSNKSDLNIHPGDIVDAAIDISHLHFFDKETEDTIVPRVPTTNLFDCEVKDNVLHFLTLNVKLPSAIKIDDITDAELLIPTKAIKLGEGEYEATVKYIEEINDVKLCYLEIDNRIFFTEVKDSLEIGSKIKLSIDFTQISIQKDDNEIVEPLIERDALIASLASSSTIKESEKALTTFVNNEVKLYERKINESLANDLRSIEIDPKIIKIYKNQCKDEIAKVKAQVSFDLSKGDLGKQGKKKVKEDGDKKILEIKNKYDKLIDEVQDRFKQLNNRNSEQKAKDDLKVKELRDVANAKIENAHKLLAEYIKLIPSNDKYIKEDSAKEVQRTLGELNKARKAGIEAEYLRNNKNKEALAEAKKNKQNVNDVVLLEPNDVEKDYIVKNENYQFALRQGYLNINGYAVKVTNDIESKMIQALSANTFKSIYRVEIPHNAYSETDGKGLNLEVLDILDYGATKYLKCSSFGKVLYVENNSKHKVGDKISVIIDITKCEIYENKFDIRLY